MGEMNRSLDDGYVKYVSPFGSSKWMPIWRAKIVLAGESRRWKRLDELDMLSNEQRRSGPPRIEHDHATPTRHRGDEFSPRFSVDTTELIHPSLEEP